MKALGPSAKSSVLPTLAKASAVSFHSVASSSLMAWAATLRLAQTACGALATIRAARVWAASRASPGSTRTLTRPSS